MAAYPRPASRSAAAPTIFAALRLALFAKIYGIVLVHRQQAFAATGRSKNDHCVAAWRATLAQLPPSCRAITAACPVSAPSSREITSAISRPESPPTNSASATCGSSARQPPGRPRRPHHRSPLRRRRNSLPARRRSRSRADNAPTTWPASSTTPRWRVLRRFMRPIAR